MECVARLSASLAYHIRYKLVCIANSENLLIEILIIINLLALLKLCTLIVKILLEPL